MFVVDTTVVPQLLADWFERWVSTACWVAELKAPLIVSSFMWLPLVRFRQEKTKV